jgi:hypothetical protein
MTSGMIEIHLTLAESVVQKLRRMAQARGTTEETIIAQALDLLFELDDTPPLNDYWFSVAAMREDWEAMPEDWNADEVSHATPTG